MAQGVRHVNVLNHVSLLRYVHLAYCRAKSTYSGEGQPCHRTDDSALGLLPGTPFVAEASYPGVRTLAGACNVACRKAFWLCRAPTGSCKAMRENPVTIAIRFRCNTKNLTDVRSSL